MPRFSKKANLVKELESVIQVRTLKAYLRFYLDAEDRFEDELDYYLLMKLALLKSQRYAFRSPYRTWNSSWERMLYDGMYMTETEFLSNFRMDRACIHQLTELIKDDEVFSKCWGKRDKRPVVLHIMVFLRYLGSYGNEASLQKIGLAMGLSKGAVNDCVIRVSQAILKLQKKVITWPNEEERKQIGSRIKKAYGFVNCVGLIDGTLFPLAYAPTLNAEDYFTRKGNYAIKALFVCDDKARITLVEMGWPGSVHDNRVWLNSDVYLAKERYFSSKEYLLGDSAFSASMVMVPAFKKSPNAALSDERKYFNTKLAKVRIKSEHCIGLVKARFQRVRELRRVIGSKRDLAALLQMIMCACILHNLLIDHVIPEEWLEEQAETEDDDEELEQHDTERANRRDQVFYYMMEMR